jgi:hypothetical protein
VGFGMLMGMKQGREKVLSLRYPQVAWLITLALFIASTRSLSILRSRKRGFLLDAVRADYTIVFQPMDEYNT